MSEFERAILRSDLRTAMSVLRLPGEDSCRWATGLSVEDGSHEIFNAGMRWGPGDPASIFFVEKAAPSLTEHPVF